VDAQAENLEGNTFLCTSLHMYGELAMLAKH
jgi:hypothetical protein